MHVESDRQILDRWPALARLASSAARNPNGPAAAYFRDLEAAIASGDERQLDHVLRSGGVR